MFKPDGRRQRPEPADWKIAQRLGDLSSEEVVIAVVQSGAFDGTAAYIGRTRLLKLFQASGYTGNVRTLKADLERWEIEYRPSDGCPSTADLRAAVEDGRIMVSSENVPGAATLSRIKSPHERRITAKRMLHREGQILQHLERLAATVDREARSSETRRDRIERVLDDIAEQIGPERPLLSDLDLAAFVDRQAAEAEHRRRQARRWPVALA